jgi:DNA-binding CsgD family transcriptional regulator
MARDVDIASILMAIGRMEGKLDMLLTRGEGRAAAPLPEPDRKREVKPVNLGAEAFFRQFTPRQHATLQMLMRGCENREIAERLGVTDNTVKVHVRNIARRLGVNNRVQVALRSARMMEQIDDNSYRLISGGLPKNWDTEYVVPDPFESIYRRAGEEEEETGHA